MMHGFASMVEKPEPMLMDNQELVHLDPSASLLSSAYMVETTEPIWKDNQEMVNVDCFASLSSVPLQKHDVFLSFRGVDTRQNIISHLYHELQHRGIQTFKDDKGLEIGDPISPSLLKAIEQSNFAIVVLSKNYASSTWCLEELTKICQCMKDKNRILPLFYDVVPTDVRYQKGNFEEAFTNHEKSGRHKSEKVKQWRKALETVANISGWNWNTENSTTEREFVEAIVESVCSKVRPIEIEFIMSSRDFEPFKATRQAIGNVMKALKDENITIIGVHGMGGIGKTTMVEHVGAKALKKGLFDKVIKADISQNPDIRKIQDTFAEMLDVKLVRETDHGRAITLMNIIRRNTILIILDDIWDEIDLSRIGIPRYKPQSCNSKVLLTTRSLDVCRSMECQAIIHLHILSEEDSWNLFVKKTGMSFQKSTNLYDIARNVAKECAGLPVALVAVAKALRDKGLDDWKDAARRLKASQLVSPEVERVVFNSIKLSYDYLRFDDAKSCFLLCCLFPEDCNIKIEDLLKYGLGKGLFQDSNTMEDARATARFMVKYLKDCSLLLDTEQDGYVKMHDVIRDVAISISLSKDGRPLFLVKAGCELKYWPRTAHECYSAISLMRNKIRMLPERLVFSELQILLLQSNFHMNEIPDFCFQSLNALVVLDLSQTKISLLPSSFSLLTNLHTLYLDSCLAAISNISILGELRKLEILSMRELPLVKLPKEIGHLTALRMLDFSGECVDVPPKVIGNLVNLEELYMQCNFADWGSKIDEAGEETSAAFDELTGLLRLNIVKVFISDAKCLPTKVDVKPDWEKFDICISIDPSIRESSLVSSSSFDHSKTLTLDTAINTLPEWFIDVVTKKAEKLQYIECWQLGNILMEYDYGKLHDLKYLSVKGPNKNLEELMNSITRVQNKPVFQKLEELHLIQLFCLKELCVGELPPGSLCKLRLLKVKECYDLMNVLLQSTLLQRLQSLEILICEEIDGLEYVFASEGLEPEQIVLTKLIEMRLENLVKLIKIWNGPAPCAVFQHVKILVVLECHKLENLFTSDVAQCLYKLEDLTVKGCHRLDRVIDANEETVNNKIGFPELKNLTLVKLLNLTRFYGSTGSATTDRENIECPSLKHLHVHHCPRFSISASDFNSQNHIEFNDDE